MSLPIVQLFIFKEKARISWRYVCEVKRSRTELTLYLMTYLTLNVIIGSYEDMRRKPTPSILYLFRKKKDWIFSRTDRYIHVHMATSSFYWWRKTPHLRISEYSQVWVEPTTHHRSAGRPPHMKVFVPTGILTHAANGL